MTLEEALAFMDDGDEPLVFEFLKNSGMSRADLEKTGARVLAGRTQYGILNGVTDTRDWGKEAHEEYLDMRWYQACAAVFGA